MVTKAKTRLSLVWESFRDTAVISGMGIAAFVIQEVRHGRSLETPNARMVFLALAVFALTWLATFIACVLGGTTATDDYDGGSSGWQVRVPTSFAVGFLTAFIAFIVLLLAGVLV
jgi:hypothetical protein